MIKQKRGPYLDYVLEDYVVFDGQWHRCSEGDHPLRGNHRILIPWMGSVWTASRDPVFSRWNIVGTKHYRLSQDIELWMPMPDAPDEEQPHDAFSRKPRSMMKEELT